MTASSQSPRARFEHNAGKVKQNSTFTTSYDVASVTRAPAGKGTNSVKANGAKPNNPGQPSQNRPNLPGKPRFPGASTLANAGGKPTLNRPGRRPNSTWNWNTGGSGALLTDQTNTGGNAFSLTEPTTVDPSTLDPTGLLYQSPPGTPPDLVPVVPAQSVTDAQNALGSDANPDDVVAAAVADVTDKAHQDGREPTINEVTIVINKALGPGATYQDKANAVGTAVNTLTQHGAPVSAGNIGNILQGVGVASAGSLATVLPSLLGPNASAPDIMAVVKGAGQPAAVQISVAKAVIAAQKQMNGGNTGGGGGGSDGGGGGSDGGGGGSDGGGESSPVAGGPSNIGSTPSDSDSATPPVPQNRRFLRIANNTGETLLVSIKYRTMTDKSEWLWLPGEPGDEKVARFRIPAGKAGLVKHEDFQVNASRIRIWARSESGAEWAGYKNQDFLLVPETDRDGRHIYYAREMEVATFRFDR